MLRKVKVEEFLRNECQKISLKEISEGFDGISASQIAEELGMDRANVSKELNQLVSSQKVIKVAGRPVHFFDVAMFERVAQKKCASFEVFQLRELLKEKNESSEDPFDMIIGNDASLKTVIKKAKAAMIYPPFGLHSLLIGPTGVGKTMFAEIMYAFAKMQGVLNDKAEFVVFNCAEYADNPQLLLGQLFGYVKGAFTGADKDSEGLVSRANQGILFLDEIHRLPPEGQEMLFLLLDKNEYRRMGDNTNSTANVLVLAATTEEVSSTLLQTFLRRIPMTIQIPALLERSFKERLDLIEKFLRQEYSQLKMPIYITKKGLKGLMGYDCPGNIGQLKADIRLLCARAFLEYKAKNLPRVEINSSLLTDSMYAGIVKSERNNELMEILNTRAGNLYVYDTEIVFESYDFYDVEDVYELIENQFCEYTQAGYSPEEIRARLKQQLEEYVIRLVSKLDHTNMEQIDELFKIVSPRIYQSVEVTLQIAEHRLGRKIPKKAYAAMALHISAILENNVVHSAFNANQYDMAMEHPAEYKIAKSVKNILENELDIKLPDQEIIFITLFLSMEEESINDETKIGLLVLAHGNGVAQKMVEVANTLLCTNHGYGLDMPLKMEVHEFLDQVIEQVRIIDQGKGVLLMVDMGSLLSFGELITERTGIEVRTVEMVSTPLVLEATRKTMTTESSLEQLSLEFKQMLPYIGRTSSQEIKQRIQKGSVIICTCLTGEGAAIKLGNLLTSAIPLIREYKVEIIPCNKETFYKKELNNKNILAVVGAVDLKLENTPYISSDKMILKDGITEVSRILIRNFGLKEEKLVNSNVIARTVLEESLTFLDLDKADHVIQKSFEMIERQLAILDYNRVLVNYILHIGSMVERCIQGQTMNYDKIQELIQQNADLYRTIRSAMMVIEEELNCTIPDTEIGYVMELFDTD